MTRRLAPVTRPQHLPPLESTDTRCRPQGRPSLTLEAEFADPNDTVNTPPLPDRSRVFVVIEPAAELVPRRTAPPAWEAPITLDQFAEPLHAELDPPVVVLSPVVIDAKSSKNSVVDEGVVTALPLAVVRTVSVVAPPPLTVIAASL